MTPFALMTTRRELPWSVLANFDKDMEGYFDAWAKNESFAPAAEIVDGPKAYMLYLDVPGFRKEDFEIEIKDRHIVITGARMPVQRSEEEKLLRQERRFGKFQRSFGLPDSINEAGITAKFNEGVLEIVIPKSEFAGRKINIT